MSLLKVENLSVRFPVRRGFMKPKGYLRAVDDVSFTVERGRTLAIVGESGSGKTTAALAVARLVPIHSGTVHLDGDELTALEGEGLRKARANLQFIFQDPYSSLNPRLRAEAIVREPLVNTGTVPKSEHEAIVDRLFAAVGLRPEQKRLFPHQFSGGQRQRLGIARALTTQPKLIVCDEAVSALDVAVQAQILNLLRRLQREFDLTYLFISHDLGVVQHMCDDVAVMYMGKVVERGSRAQLFSNPLHPYTVALLSAVPRIEKSIDTDGAARSRRKRMLIPGDPIDPVDPPPGCRFANRCPVAQSRCRTDPPPLVPRSNGQHVACHLVPDDPISPVADEAEAVMA